MQEESARVAHPVSPVPAPPQADTSVDLATMRELSRQLTASTASFRDTGVDAVDVLEKAQQTHQSMQSVLDGARV